MVECVKQIALQRLGAVGVFEKNLKIGVLLDFYGAILSERKRTVLDDYYNADMSLAEIAEEIGISRQGVRELIQKAGDELLLYEEKLGFAEKFQSARASAEEMQVLLKAGNTEEVQKALEELSATLR